MAVVGAGRMPEQLTLRRALEAFLEFRVECLQRRCRYRLARAEARLHIVDGMLVAQARMDEVVSTIRASPNATAARLLGMYLKAGHVAGGAPAAQRLILHRRYPCNVGDRK